MNEVWTCFNNNVSNTVSFIETYIPYTCKIGTLRKIGRRFKETHCIIFAMFLFLSFSSKMKAIFLKIAYLGGKVTGNFFS